LLVITFVSLGESADVLFCTVLSILFIIIISISSIVISMILWGGGAGLVPWAGVLWDVT